MSNSKWEKAIEHLKELQSLQPELRLKQFEDRFDLLESQREAILKTLNRAERALVRSVPAALLNSRHANTFTWKYPDGATIVTLTNGLLVFITRTSIAHCSQFYFDGDQDSDDQSVPFEYAFRSIVRSCLQFRRPSSFESTRGKEDEFDFPEFPMNKGEMLLLLILGQQLFLVAHEYAHILLGHRDKDYEFYPGCVARNVLENPNEMPKMHERELEADEKAYSILKAYVRKENGENLGVTSLNELWRGIVESSPYMLFTNLYLTETVLDIPRNPFAPFQAIMPFKLHDHPTPYIRRMRLMTSIEDPDSWDFAKAYIDIGDRIISLARKKEMSLYIRRLVSETTPEHE